MLVLAIETSCDDTSAAVVNNGVEVLSSVIASQTEFHKKYGGIVPEIASRRHIEVINPVIKEALERADKDFGDLDAVAVTCGPGLVGSLLVGVCAAKAVSYSLDIPLIGVNHLEGHMYANFINSHSLSKRGGNPNEEREGVSFPFICLIVSGGHTMIVEAKGYGKYRTLGQTRDDAAGEAFDKVARFLKLGFPGGPVIDRLAKEGDPKAIDFKRPMLEEEYGYDFSFSGIKTAVVNYVMRNAQRGMRTQDIVASFQRAVVDVLVEKTVKAAVENGIGNICLAGGVSANSLLRSELMLRGAEAGLRVTIPPFEYTTDNAAMIACAGFHRLKADGPSQLSIKPVAGLKL